MDKQTKPASEEFIAEKNGIVQTLFYDTPDEVFAGITKAMLFLKLTEKEVVGVLSDAVFSIRKTRITVADVLAEIAKNKRTPFCEAERGRETTINSNYDYVIDGKVVRFIDGKPVPIEEIRKNAE
jgi:hypothetical protein